MKTMRDALDLNSMDNKLYVWLLWQMPRLHGACMWLESPLGWYISIYNIIVHANFA